MEYIKVQKELGMKDNLKMIYSMVKELKYLKMEQSIMEVIVKVIKKDMANIFGMTDHIMMETGIKIR